MIMIKVPLHTFDCNQLLNTYKCNCLSLAQMLPGSAQRLQFTVTVKEYEDFLGEQGTLMGTFLAYSEVQDVSWISRIPVNLGLPSLNIDIDKKGIKVHCLSERG